MLLDRAWIAAHIPHQGSMCLLDEVIEWTSVNIRCRSESHHREDNPLRAHGRLGAACGIEYAAQAMAVHGALLNAGTSKLLRPGMLASVRGLTMHVERLDPPRRSPAAARHADSLAKGHQRKFAHPSETAQDEPDASPARRR